MLSQLFFLAKGDELLRIFAQSTDLQEKNNAVSALSDIDPSNASKYQQIIQ
jgi:hypothetical protein